MKFALSAFLLAALVSAASAQTTAPLGPGSGGGPGGGGGGASPAGATGTVQYNAGGGLFGGITNWKTSGTNDLTGSGGSTLAVSGCTIGSYAMCTGGTSNLVGAVTLGTQQTTQGSLVLANTAAGAFSTTIQSSNSATSAYTITLPVAAPVGNGYALTATTGGVASWSNIGTGPFLPLAGGTMSGALTNTATAPQIILGVNTSVGGGIQMYGSSSGNLTLQPAAAAGSSVTVTIPGATDTLANLASSQTLTNKTIAFASNTMTGVAPLASPTFTGIATTPSLNLSGAISLNNSATSGFSLLQTASNYTDSGTTGTTAALYDNVLGGNTILATNTKTYTQEFSLYVLADTAGTGSTFTNQWAIGAPTAYLGNSSRQLTVNSGSASPFAMNNTTGGAGATLTFQGTLSAGSSTQTVITIGTTIAQSSTAGYTALSIFPTESSTGSGAKNLINAGIGSTAYFTVTDTGALSATLANSGAADVVCYAAGTNGLMTYTTIAVACVVSDENAKEEMTPVDGKYALNVIEHSKPISFVYRPEMKLGNDHHLGFGAQTLERAAPELVTYDQQGPKVKQLELTAYTWAAMQAMQYEIEELKRRLPH